MSTSEHNYLHNYLISYMQIIGGNFGQLKNIQSTTNIRREGKTKDKPRGGFSQSKLNILKLILIYP